MPSPVPTAQPTAAPTRSPTAVPSVAPTDEPPVCSDTTSYTRLVRKRGASPYLPLQIPVAFLTHNGFLTASFEIQAQPGDLFRFQWNSLCQFMALVPAPLDFGLLGHRGTGSRQVSTFLVIETQ